MLTTLLTVALLNTNIPDPIATAQEHFDQSQSYRVTVRSWSKDGDHSEIHYAYRKPGQIRMDFIEPHCGVTLVYDPNNHKVRLWPFGTDSFPVLTLSPTNPLLHESSGHRVDQSDIGTLLHNIHSLQQDGETTVLGEETLNDRPALHLIITGAPGREIDGIHRYQIWLDRTIWFPLKVISYMVNDELQETVLMDNMEINVSFPDHFFDP